MNLVPLRVRAAASIIRHGIPKAPRRGSRDLKESPFRWAAWREEKPQWQMLDVQNYIEEGYTRNSVIHTCVMYKGRQLTASPLRAYQGDEEHPEIAPVNHPTQRLLARPNPYMSNAELVLLHTVYLNVTGNSYWYLSRPTIDAMPTEIWLLRPDRVYIVPKDGGLKGFMYVPEGQSVYSAMPILPQDMIHIKFPNPLDPLEGLGYGLSPIAPIARTGDVDNNITDFLKLFFQRGMMPPALIRAKTRLEDTEIARIRERWRDVYGSYENWTDVGVLDSDTEYVKLSQDFDKLGFQAMDERSEARIHGPFGVPPILTGSRLGMSNSTYANYETARRACWEDTLIPEQTLAIAEMGYYVVSRDGAFVKWDNSNVPALKQDVPKLVESAHKLWTMGVPANTAFETVGLDAPMIEGGDIAFVPNSVTTVEAAVEMLAAKLQILLNPPKPELPPGQGSDDEEPETEEPPEDEANATEDERPSKMGRPSSKGRQTEKGRKSDDFEPHPMQVKIDGIAESHEGKFRSTARKQFEKDQREMLALITEAKDRALRAKASIQWLNLVDDLASMITASGERWRSAFSPLIAGVVTDAGEAWGSELGVEFNLRNVEGEAWFADYMLTFADPISETTRDGMYDLLAQGQADGWTTQQMTNAIRSTFQQWMHGDLSAEDFDFINARLPAYRAEMIARTETMRASNAGAHQLAKDYGARKKKWLATSDDRTRDSHRSADGQVKDIDDPFEVGGAQLMYPLDGSLGAPAKEIVNCRCAYAPVLPEDEPAAVGPEGFFAEGEEEAIREKMRSEFGREMTPAELAQLTGLDSRYRVQITTPEGDAKGLLLLVDNQHDIEEMRRHIFRGAESGQMRCKNDVFVLNESARGGGIGTRIFGAQVEALRAQGFTQIETSASRGELANTTANGYYTWARLGYDARLNLTLRERYQEETGNEANRVSDLMQSQQGRDWWRVNGRTTQMTFDLADNSLSMRVLNEYRQRRGL